MHRREHYGCDIDATPVLAVEVFFPPECVYPKTGRILTETGLVDL